MWHQKSAKSVIREFETDETSGLTSDEVKRRLAKYGPNTLPTKKKPPLIFKFFSQFKSFLVIILLVATLVSFALGEHLDAFAILSIVIIYVKFLAFLGGGFALYLCGFLGFLLAVKDLVHQVFAIGLTFGFFLL